MTHSHSLNPKQQEAVLSTKGAVLVIAGAGSGKTKVVSTRIAHLIDEGIPPSSILGVTFTNKAAAEMRERVHGMTNQQVLICTFHSLGARILRECISNIGYSNAFTIYDEEDTLKIIKLCLADLGLSDDKSFAKTFRHSISAAKNALLSPEAATKTAKTDDEEIFAKVYTFYDRHLKAYNGVDFDDLLYLPIRIWQEHKDILAQYQKRWPHLLIDEYQDTNVAQYTLARLLVESQGNIFVVGDPDQSIYSWRGANIQNILNFEKDYPGAKVIQLEQNYRSTTTILNAANALIAHNVGRFEKKLWSQLHTGEKIRLFMAETERNETQFVAREIARYKKMGIPLKEMVVFYRTNAQSRPFEDTLLSCNIPYTIVGGISFYQRKEIKDILAFLRIAYTGCDFIAFARTINLPRRGFGETTIEKIKQGALDAGVPLLSFCSQLLENTPSIKLSAKQKAGLKEWVSHIQHLQALTETASIKDIVIAAIETTGYLDHLKEDNETEIERKENLSSLIAKAAEWQSTAPNPTLGGFLEEITLKSSLDEAESDNDRLTLMTLHSGKGLEFQVVFIAGLEENLFPHVNAKNESSNIEEERRLCYVGITRAKQYLTLTLSKTRMLWGALHHQYLSRFIKEIPREYLEIAKR